ncbi:uncharacterized protein [Primulina eburnea]|uniref:uncharacterized protein n=1 Tax=Primulina eburnea TaxID=1245227 RepID=UPI003C6C15E5
MNWQEVKRQFHIQFYRTDPEVCIANLSRVTQKKGESMEYFIDMFKKIKNRCKEEITRYGVRDFFELAAKVPEYEELLREESYKKKTAMGSYYQEVEDVVLAEFNRMPPTEELKGREREYCKYHNSYNHATKSCWVFKNILQDRINKGVVKFPNKQDSMALDDDHFPSVALVNVNVTDLRDLLNEERSRSFAVKDRVIKKYWIPKGQLFEAHGRHNVD